MKTIVRKILHGLLGDYYLDISLWWFFFRLTPVPPGDKPRLLVIDHVFDQDLEALQRANSKYSFIIINAFFLRNIATLTFPPSVESYRSYNGTEMAPIRRRWRSVMDRFVKRVHKKYSICAVIAPSDNFFYVRELISALHDRKIPYYVIDKEGTICPAYFEHFAKYIKDHCPLIADHILVWSDRQRDFWLKTGVVSDMITVTGQPRSDFWKQSDRWLTKKQLGIPGLRTGHKLFLFFTYDPWAYTPDYMVERGEMHWEELRHQTHDVLFNFARQHSEIDVVIKAHPQQVDLHELQATIARSGTNNVYLATGSKISNHLIVNADCIIGFQTTALIEAMVTDKPIIYTFWGEARDRWANDLIPFHKSRGLTVASSQSELLQVLESSLNPTPILKEQREARHDFVNEYLSSIDGLAAKRTIDELDRLIRRQI